MNRCAAVLVGLLAAAAAPTSTTAPDVDPALWQQMVAIDAKAQHVDALAADFRQEKFTPLMKKPLVSTGTIQARGATALWTTETPEPTRMLVNDREIQMYYPRQRVEEIYPIGGRLGSLASSPLPRLAVLRQFFSFAPIPARDLDPAGDDVRDLALALKPIDAQLREHVAQVRVLLDRENGLVKIAETIDPDGERTKLSFTNVQINPSRQPAELTVSIPAGTAVSRPLAGLGDGGADSVPRARPTSAGADH